MDKSSLFKISGLPDSFGVVLLSFSFILFLAPYFSGADFGLFKIPIFTQGAKKWLKIIGPILFILCAAAFVPLFRDSNKIDGNAAATPSPTNLSNAPDYSRHTKVADPQFLHPLLRERANKLLERARAEGINLFYFETYRPPKEQHTLYMIGREEAVTYVDGKEVKEKEQTVTNSDAWASRFQYGLAVIVLPYGGEQWNSNPDENTRSRLSNLASSVGLVTASGGQDTTFVLPDIKIEDLKAGRYPSGGDRSWADNLNGNIMSWGSQEPKAPPKVVLLQ